MRRGIFGGSLVILWLAGMLPGGTLYVNNLTGRTRNDGSTPEALNSLSGPVNSINQALKIAATGDTIVVANTGVPYYEGITLSGVRLGGVPEIPLTIIGNGAILSGLRGLPPQGWRQLPDSNVWEVSFNRKGFYRLLRDGKTLPEYRPDGAAHPVETLPIGQWTDYRGRVFFRAEAGDQPPTDRFDYAADEMGITLYQVEYVRIVDLTVQHFRVDGINAFNQCRKIELENVTSRENGRAGLAVGGSSSVVFRQGRLENNGRESAFISGKGSLLVDESQLDATPTVEP